MMKSVGKSRIRVFTLSLSLFAGLLVAGCRQEDVREMTIEMPGLVEANKAEIVKWLSKYEGVKLNSFEWDMRAKTLTLKYDSMKIAQSNIRYAIDENGVKVQFPVKVDDHAGY